MESVEISGQKYLRFTWVEFYDLELDQIDEVRKCATFNYWKSIKNTVIPIEMAERYNLIGRN